MALWNRSKRVQQMTVKSPTIFVAEDGSFGDAYGMVLVQTHDWDESDWDELSNTTDNDRVAIAIEITNRKRA